MTKTSENAIIFVTGVASSVLCITGYDLMTSTTNDDALNGLLLLFIGAVLFCGVAYGFYGINRPEGKFSYHATRRLREVKAAPFTSQVKEIPEAAHATGASDAATTSSGKPAVAVMRLGLRSLDRSAGVRRGIAAHNAPRVEPAPVDPPPQQNNPVAAKIDASAIAENDEVSAANDLIKVYTQLLIKVKEPSKRKTLKRWIAQQEEIVKARKVKQDPAKSA